MRSSVFSLRRLVLALVVCTFFLQLASAGRRAQRREARKLERQARDRAFKAELAARGLLKTRQDDSGDDSTGDGAGNIATPGDNDPGELTQAPGFTDPRCAPWYPIRDYIMKEIFGGVCGDLARGAIRLSFHDAGTFSRELALQGAPNGGADGSMLSDPTEVQRSENNGLQDIVAALQPLPAMFNVTNGDLLQIAGILAVMTCPGGPFIRTYIGRLESQNPSPMGLLPDPAQNVSSLLDRFADMGMDNDDLTALIGAHSTATQQFVDPNFAGDAMDTSVDIWDVTFYSEVGNLSATGFTGGSAPDGAYRLQSDMAIASSHITFFEFSEFIDDAQDWKEDYADAHSRMSMLGQDEAAMINCDEILPPEILITDDMLLPDTAIPMQKDAEVNRTALNLVIQEMRAPWLPNDTSVEEQLVKMNKKKNRKRNPHLKQ